jgi:AcrR family transcriptional regulator
MRKYHYHYDSYAIVSVMSRASATDPPKRDQARTRLARRAVVRAARTLFVEHGYATTTIGAISRAADVPEPTVYRLFASKVGILKAVVDTSIAGDDDTPAVHERAPVAALLGHPDAPTVLAGFAAVTTAINRRTSDIYDVLRRAADVDLEARALFDELRRQRDEGQGRVVRSLHRAGALRKTQRVRDATDIVHAIMAPEVYRLLVHDRGWTPERYRQWAADTLVQQLT